MNPRNALALLYKVVDSQPLSFRRDAAGKVDTVVLHQNGQDIKGMKQKP